MTHYQFINVNNKTFQKNVYKNLNHPIEEGTTNSDTVILNSEQEANNEDYNASSDNKVLNNKIKGNIFKVIKPRKYDFDNAKPCILTSCMKSIGSLVKFILILVGLGEDFKINATSRDKFGNSFDENRNFFQKKIKDIFCNSTQKNTKNKIQKKTDTTNILSSILEQEKISLSIKIKLFNAIFNLPYKYFLYAYLKDFTYIMIRLDKNGKTIVTFLPDNNPYKDSLNNLSIFKFKTYKDCFTEKYDKERKEKINKKI